MLAAGTLPAAARPYIWSDVYATYADHLAGGRLPYWDTFFDYPPGIGYVAGLFARISNGPVAYVLLWSAVAMCAAAAVGYLLARAATPSRAILFWSLSPQLLLYGGASFDVVPLALLVMGVALARRGRSPAAMILLALGAIAKVFPAVAAPLELERIRRARGSRAALRGAAVFAATVALVAAPSLLAPFPSTSSVLFQAARTNFDSVFGLALAALEGLRVPGASGVVGVIAAVGLVVTYALVIRRADPRADLARLTLLGLVALLLWSRLYSPQYSVWVLPFLALTGATFRPYALLVIADVVVFATVYPLTLVPWGAADVLRTILFGAVAVGIALRHVALILVWRAAWRPA